MLKKLIIISHHQATVKVEQIDKIQTIWLLILIERN